MQPSKKQQMQKASQIRSRVERLRRELKDAAAEVSQLENDILVAESELNALMGTL